MSAPKKFAVARDNRVRRTVWNASKLSPLLAATFLPMLYLIIVVA